MLANRIYSLSVEKLLNLRENLSSAALAYELRGPSGARAIFRRAKYNASPGYELKLYQYLEKAPPDGLSALSCVVEKEFKQLTENSHVQ